MRILGRVKWFDHNRQDGVIDIGDDNLALITHHSNQGQVLNLIDGQLVTLRVFESDDGYFLKAMEIKAQL